MYYALHYSVIIQYDYYDSDVYMACVSNMLFALQPVCIPTFFSQDNLAGAGAGYTVMVLNVGPSPNDFDETVHALKYGALAKDIKIAPPKINSR